MKFTDPMRFADHVGKQLKSRLVETIGKELEAKARSNNNALDVCLKNADHATIREVQSWLRCRGWTIQNDLGGNFKVLRL